MRPSERVLSLALDRRLWAGRRHWRAKRDASEWRTRGRRVRDRARRVWEEWVWRRRSEGARRHGWKHRVGRQMRRMEDGRVWDEVASSRWQTAERWELGSMSWREHGGARRRGSFHRVGVALVSSVVSLLFSWVLLGRRRSGAESMAAQLVSTTIVEGLALGPSGRPSGINKVPVKDSKNMLLEGPASSEGLTPALPQLLPLTR